MPHVCLGCGRWGLTLIGALHAKKDLVSCPYTTCSYGLCNNSMLSLLQRFAGRLRDCSRVESYSCKHNWPQHCTLL